MQIKHTPQDFVVLEQTNREPKLEGPLYFYSVTKTNMTTHAMVKYLAAENGLSYKHIRYAGTKDKRAVTTQHITSPKPLQSSSQAVSVTHLGCVDHHLGLGDLLSNKFRIRVYDVQQTHDTHIPNYFGEQRFSSRNVSVGLELLKGDFLSVAQKLRAEFSQVDELLNQKPNDAVSALRKAPLKILLLYVHSVQSALYNKAVSQYIKDTYDSFHEISSSQGPLRFPYEKLPDMSVPIVGAVSELGDWDKYYRPLMDEFGIHQQNFMVRSFPQLTQEGTTRSLAADIRNKDVEQTESVVDVNLELGSGCYATIVLKGLLS